MGGDRLGMPNNGDLFSNRKPLGEICEVPEKIISVYSLEQHIWADCNAPEARKIRKPEIQTIEEFQIDPVRPFLNDILRNMAAPYKREKKDNLIGQGYWIQAEFGSGKSHLLCFLASLALGSQEAWDIIKAKEQKAGRGKRESIYQFWEGGLQAKNTKGNRGIFVVARTLVGSGGGTVGRTDKGKRLSEYILDAVKEQLQLELGKNLSLYPVELLADRFLTEDLDRYRKDLKKFLKNPKYFSEDEFEDADNFIRDIQDNKSPDYKMSCGNKLWRFYTEFLKVQPQIPAETEDILNHVVETIMAEGYTGVLIFLDEISLFMKDRDEMQRVDDEKTLVVLSNRLAKVHNLPVWIVCAAQQAIESKPGQGVKNIIAEERLKLYPLLQNPKDYYDIVLARVREIKNPEAIKNYYLYYKRGFTWPNSIGEREFAHFFPFYMPAVEVLRDITHELTTARSAIHFMHQTLKHQIKIKGKELIRLWEYFDEAMEYEEDPSGVHAGLVAIKTKRENEYRAYESCRNQINGLTKGQLKVHGQKGIRIVQTLFLYYIAHRDINGLSVEKIANSVMIERQPDATPEENLQHYETLAEALKNELRQIVQSFDEDKNPLYRFEPVVVGIDPQREFFKARDEAEGNEAIQKESWEALLSIEEWLVHTRQMNMDLADGNKSFLAGFAGAANGVIIDILWQGRHIYGRIDMVDINRIVAEGTPLTGIYSDQDDLDFAVIIARRPVQGKTLDTLMQRVKDKRILFWVPDNLNHEEKSLLLDFAAYRKLVYSWEEKDTDDAVTIINWVAGKLKTEIGKICRLVRSSYGRGRIDALNNTCMDFNIAGELKAVLTPLVDRVLSSVYVSADIKFDPPFEFRKEEGVKLINGIVKTGAIPKGAKPNQNISAAQNFGYSLRVMKKGPEKALNTEDNTYVGDIWQFIDDHLTEGQEMKLDTLYKNFMGVGGPKDYGLTRRMVQIYLLCLVQQGRVQVSVGPQAGLSCQVIDYSNIADIDFSAKVLDKMEKLQKVARPENWEVLRPYLEKIMEKSILAGLTDEQISQKRLEMRNLFKMVREEVRRASENAAALFECLDFANPYGEEMEQVSRLYATDLEASNDIDLLLSALKDIFGYQAFDTMRPDEAELKDLGNRLACYQSVCQLLKYETDLRVGRAYVQHILPDFKDLQLVKQQQKLVAEKMAEFNKYLDEEIKLRNELIGHKPPLQNEDGTIFKLMHEYRLVYIAMHDKATQRCNHAHQSIERLVTGSDFQAIVALEGITALQPEFSSTLHQRLEKLADGVFQCANDSRASLEKQLKAGPLHECDLSFSNYGSIIEKAESSLRQAGEIWEKTVNGKLEVFLNQAIQEKLKQGKDEPIIAALLACSTVEEVRKILLREVAVDPAIVDTINRFLKKIVVKAVKKADFKPSVTVVEEGQIEDIVREFQEFLAKQFADMESDEDTIPVLMLE